MQTKKQFLTKKTSFICRKVEKNTPFVFKQRFGNINGILLDRHTIIGL